MFMMFVACETEFCSQAVGISKSMHIVTFQDINHENPVGGVNHDIPPARDV